MSASKKSNRSLRPPSKNTYSPSVSKKGPKSQITRQQIFLGTSEWGGGGGGFRGF